MAATVTEIILRDGPLTYGRFSSVQKMYQYLEQVVIPNDKITVHSARVLDMNLFLGSNHK
jgi:hypothetical protein